MIAIKRERKRNGLHATAIQLITRERPNSGSFANTTTETIISKLYQAGPGMPAGEPAEPATSEKGPTIEELD